MIYGYPVDAAAKYYLEVVDLGDTVSLWAKYNQIIGQRFIGEYPKADFLALMQGAKEAA